ncbi:MAG: hypothetical protein JWQ97_657 [Phenylobacterium sp.]|nr:hypothetical protein [Phenylobacterium sp.]
MNRAFLCAALAASVVLSAAAASAEEGQMKVQVSDLNLRAPAGAQIALSRLRRQVNVFCQADEGRRSLGAEVDVKRCVSDMSRKAVAALNAPLVTALYEKRALPTETKVLAVAQN